MQEELPQKHWEFDGFVVDTTKRQLLHDGAPLALTPKQFDTLEFLVRNHCRIVTKEELLKAIWPDSFVEESNLSQNVFWLRKALRTGGGDENSTRYIVTVPGRGYRFAAHINPEEPAAPAPTPVEAIPVTEPPTPLPVTRPKWLVPAVVAAFLGLAVLGFWLYRLRKPAKPLPVVSAARRPSRSGDPNDPPIMVVLADFENNTDDPTLTNALNVVIRRELRQSSQVGILSRAWINKMLGYMTRPATTPMTVENAIEVCKRYNAHAVVHGALGSDGVGFTVAAAGCADGKPIYTGSAHADTQDELLRALDGMLPALRLKLGESEKSVREFSVPVENATTGSMEAFHAFLDAEAMRLKGESQKALPLYEKAARLDPGFAMNWGAMGTVFLSTNQRDRARNALQRAYDESAHVSARERFYLRVMYTEDVLGDFNAAHQLFQEWQVLYPADTAPWTNDTNALVALGRFDDAVNTSEEGLKRFQDGLMYAVAMEANLAAQKLNEVKRLGDEAIQHNVAGWQVREFLWEWAILTGHPDIAAEQRRAATGTDDEYNALFDELMLAMQRGQLHLAEQMMPHFLQVAKTQNATEKIDAAWGAMAEAYVVYGQPQRAAVILRQHPAQTQSFDLTCAAAMLGNRQAMAHVAAEYEKAPPQDTLYRHWALPIVQAAELVAHHSGDAALDALKPTDSIAMHDLWAEYIRGQALLDLNRPAEAATSFERDLEHSGVDAFSPANTFAALGLLKAARATNSADLEQKARARLAFLAPNPDADLPAFRAP